MIPVAVLAAGKSTRWARRRATLSLDDADTFLTWIIRRVVEPGTKPGDSGDDSGDRNSGDRS